MNNFEILGYIDPATGALVLQVIVAAVLGAGFFFRRLLLSPFRLLFCRKRNATDDLSNENGTLDD